MSRTWSKILVWVSVVLCVSSASLGLEATTAPSTAPAAPQSAPATMAAGSALEDKSGEHIAAAIAEVLIGHFAEAGEQIDKAAEIVPSDESIAAARDLLQGYRRRMRQAEAERRTEYDEAVRRVRWCMIAQRSLGGLPAGLEKKLRAKVEELASSCGKVGGSESLRDAAVEEAAKLKADSAEALTKSQQLLGEAEKLLADDDSDYGETFRALAKKLSREIESWKQLWESVQTDTPEGRDLGADELKVMESNLVEALVDVESMVAEKPWRIALMRAKDEARELALDQESLADQDWYKDLIADIERRGQEAVRDAKWYDALSAYAGLSKLSADNEEYQNTLKLIRRHVRMLGLYGNERSGGPSAPPGPGQAGLKQPATQATGNLVAPEPARWERMVSGVDAEMVDRTIRRLSASYVTAVDFRKLTRGALLSVKVLAQTPQVVDTFPNLRDEAKKQRFIEIIDRQLDAVDKTDRVDDLDLRLAFNVVLRASERTVKIPTEVVAIEFAEGFLDELDRFSAVIWPNNVADFRKHMLGQFVGVGIRINKAPDEPLKVVTPLAGSPAYKAGIRAGDAIIAVDGSATKDRDIDELVDSIMGEKGTKVVLTVKRRGGLKPIDIPVVRDKIFIRTVTGWRRRPVTGEWDYILDADQSIGYIRITQFTDETPRDVRKALKNLRSDGIKSIVLDLRINPGGLLRSAVAVANEFVDSGRIVSTRGRQVFSTTKNAKSDGTFLRGDLVVLVDKLSASAAEIVSGALKDLGRATIVGKRTYGKGSVQNVITLRHDPVTRQQLASLKLTTAYYYVGDSERLLHRENGAETWGVDPDVEVNMTPKQTDRWRQIQFSNELLQDTQTDELDQDLATQYDHDIQLQTAVVLLRLMQLQHAHPSVAKAPPAEGPVVPETQVR